MGNRFNRLTRDSTPDGVSSTADVSNTPINILLTLLEQLSEDKTAGVQGISRDVFVSHVFGEYPDFSNRMFDFLANDGSEQTPEILKRDSFNNQVKEIMNCTSYDQRFLFYVSIYCGDKRVITPYEFLPLVKVVYDIAMDNHPEGPQNCVDGTEAVDLLVEGLFRKRTEIKVIYLSHLTEQHCPRLLSILHNYVLYVLRTAYRKIMESGAKDMNLDAKLEQQDSEKSSSLFPTLPASTIWILSTTLPNIYTEPFSHRLHGVLGNYNPQYYAGTKLDFSCPTHWCLLYDSDQHGCSPNRLLYHIFDYKGPTLMFLFGEKGIDFCICISEEWRRSQQFWGDMNCFLIQLSPLYRVIHRGPNIIYSNFSFRGLNRGIQIGTERDNPTLIVNDSLNEMSFNGTPIKLNSVEVWGCGPPHLRGLQLDIKKWNLKQSTRKKSVKFNLNWQKITTESKQHSEQIDKPSSSS